MDFSRTKSSESAKKKATCSYEWVVLFFQFGKKKRCFESISVIIGDVKKNSWQKTVRRERRKSMDIKVKISKIVDDERPVRAFGELTLNDCFAVHGIRVIETEKGLTVSMPREKRVIEGTPRYFDVCHPCTTELRSEIVSAVLSAYREAKEKGTPAE